jgi:hypothetical protein
MGFIPQINTKTLYAYLTPKGRQYILDGDKVDFQIAYFSLHDDDVNYFVSSNISAGTTYYTLQSGFIPDITGDADTCIKSIAKGTGVNMLSTLSGSTIIDPETGFPTVGPIGSDGTVGSRNTRLTTNSPFINAGTLQTGRPTQTTSFVVNILPPVGDTAPLSTTEISNSKFYVRIVNPSPSSLIGNFKISGVSTSLNTDVLYSPISTSQAVNIEYTILQSPPTTQTITFDIIITPFSSNNTVSTGNLVPGTIRYVATYQVTTTTGPTRGDTTTPTDTTTTPPGTSFGGITIGQGGIGGV